MVQFSFWQHEAARPDFLGSVEFLLCCDEYEGRYSFFNTNSVLLENVHTTGRASNNENFEGVADISLEGFQPQRNGNEDGDNISLSPVSDISSLSSHSGAEDSESVLQSKQTHNAATLDPKRTLVEGDISDLIAGVVSNFTITPVDRNGKEMSTANLQLLLRHNMSDKHSKYVNLKQLLYI